MRLQGGWTRERQLGWATLGGGVLVILFWTTYFAAGASDDAVRAAFERAFVPADALLVAILFAASRALFRGRPDGPFLLVLAAGMCVYLGVLDATFQAHQGGFWPITGDGALAAAVNALCLGGGVYGVRAAWRLWRTGARP